MINLDIQGQTEPISIKASLSPEATTPTESVVIKSLICDKFADINYYGQKESGTLYCFPIRTSGNNRQMGLSVLSSSG